MRLSRQVETQLRDETIRALQNRLPPITQRDRLELIMLRISVAKGCAEAGIQTKHLPVIGKTFHELVWMANHNERGWNTLMAALEEKVST